MKYLFLILIALLHVNSSLFSQDLKVLTENFEVTLNDGFSDKSINDYEFANPSNWLITKNGTPGKDIKCNLTSVSSGTVYFPVEEMLIKELVFGDFIMEFEYMQKSRDFSVRDICVLFGYKDTTHFYFAQAAAEAGKYSHNIFKVDGDRPVKIGEAKNKGMIWDYQDWHKIVLVRNMTDKKVELYIDGELILTSNQENGEVGRVGIGTFGSGFKIDNLKIWIPKQAK